MNLKILPAVNVSAGIPEYVSTRQRRYSLRQGASLWPRVAFQRNRKGASTGPSIDGPRGNHPFGKT